MKLARTLGLGAVVLTMLALTACGTGESSCADDGRCSIDVSEDGDREAESELSEDVHTCQAACQKFYDCDHQAGLTNSPYNESWMANCKTSCTTADTIDATLAACIASSACSDVLSCKPGTK